ncbi:MAG: AAA family ATPase, partial [Rhodospirillaceae bacterium]|nr:AAA family ATPase [Rhodospirillaceae bacterium]
MPTRIHSIRIQGFRSLADFRIEPLPDVTVLLGANGAGKSNFLRFFEMMRWMLVDHRLARWVGINGGADDQLFNGADVTESINAEVIVRADLEPQCDDRYEFELMHAHPDRLVFGREESQRYFRESNVSEVWAFEGGGYTEANLFYAARSERNDELNRSARTIADAFEKCAVFQYHNTAKLRRKWDVEDRTALLDNGENLASILVKLERQHPRHLERLCTHIRRVLPGFDRFQIEQENGTA